MHFVRTKFGRPDVVEGDIAEEGRIEEKPGDPHGHPIGRPNQLLSQAVPVGLIHPESACVRAAQEIYN